MTPIDKLTAAVNDCLASASGEIKGHPFSRVKDYIAKLKISPGWTADEIIEVQSHLIGALIARLSRQYRAALLIKAE